MELGFGLVLDNILFWFRDSFGLNLRIFSESLVDLMYFRLDAVQFPSQSLAALILFPPLPDEVSNRGSNILFSYIKAEPRQNSTDSN